MISAFEDAPVSSRLERFKPTEGVPYRLYLLDWARKVELGYHYVEKSGDTPGGMYECQKGDCCLYLPPANNAVLIPIWVYTNPTADYNAGQLFSWWVPREIHKSLVQTAQTYAQQGLDIRNFDLSLTVVKQGQGTRQQIGVFPAAPGQPGSAILVFGSAPEVRQAAFESVEPWFVIADTQSLTKVQIGGWSEVFRKHHIQALPAGSPQPPALMNMPRVPSAPAPMAPGLPRATGYPPAAPQAPAGFQGAPRPQAPAPAAPQAFSAPAGFPPQQAAAPPQGFPPQPGYSAAPAQPGYPPAQPGYPPAQPAQPAAGPQGFPGQGGFPPPGGPGPGSFPQAPVGPRLQPAAGPQHAPVGAPQPGQAFETLDVSADDLEAMLDLPGNPPPPQSF